MPGSMTLADFRDLVRVRLGIPAGDALSQNAALDVLINAALRQTSVMKEWPWLENTVQVVAEPTYGGAISYVPTDFRKARYLTYESNDITFRPPREMARYRTITGPPRFFTHKARSLWVLPKPDKFYQLELTYFRSQASLEAFDATWMPDWAMDLLIAQTCLLVARRYRNREQVQSYLQERDEILKSLQDDMVQHTQGLTPLRRP